MCAPYPFEHQGAGERADEGLLRNEGGRMLCRVGADEIQALRTVLASGQAMLFTGAGFSSSACDRRGRSIPSSEEITREIWDICFPGEEQDGSSLTDLFHHASRRCPDRLDALLRERLSVSEERLPEFYRRWFSVPWKRAWTLNVDDIECAAARRFRLPRPIEPISALTTPLRPELLHTRGLVFVHLNGRVGDGVRHVTFSTTQYGERLARNDPWYSQFVDDLVHHPFVIVGTRLEEAPFWRTLHQHYGGDQAAPGEVCTAFIVSPKLTRARRILLEDIGIRWLKMSAEEFAENVLAE
ncbi:MAG TPA: SIR2 family protein, partial [Myxococcaceae bacterium]|nr:SIR2 family protein [Myxococcaceae bacterium]